MKMYSLLILVGALVAFSTVLQGCTSDTSDVKKQDIEKQLKCPECKKEETIASCNGNSFSCNGPNKEYCHQQEKLCTSVKDDEEGCHPLCKWHCDEPPQCEKQCGPECAPPVCQTRCAGFNTQSCHMKCEKPSCAVICPKDSCSDKKGCIKCVTQCGQPTCHMQCGKDLQNCHNVCAEPLCTWKCKDPTKCPPPKCQMQCKEPKNCLSSSIQKELPPLREGETQVMNFEANLARKNKLLQVHGKVSTMAKTMRVNVTTLGADQRLHTSQVELPVSRVNDAMWTSLLSKDADGKVTNSAASCTGGQFQCHGDEAWCAQQKSVVCQGSLLVNPTDGRAFMQQRAGAQAHLQA